MYVQMPLKIGLRDEASFNSFVADGESVALGLMDLQNNIQQPKGNSYYLNGGGYSGKTHVLQAACRFATESGLASVYLPLSDKSLPLIPDVLNGLEFTSLVCLDDVDRIIGHADWETALRNLLIKSATQGNTVILAGRATVDIWPMVDHELISALMGLVSVPLKVLKANSDLVEALQKHSQCMGFELPDKVGEYLVTKHSTNLEELMTMLKILEEATLTEKKKLNTAFVKTIFPEPEVKK